MDKVKGVDVAAERDEGSLRLADSRPPQKVQPNRDAGRHQSPGSENEDPQMFCLIKSLFSIIEFRW